MTPTWSSSPVSTSQMQARRSQPAVSTWFTFSLKDDISNYDDDDEKAPAALQPANPQRSPPHCDSPTTCREKSVLSISCVEDFPGLPFLLKNKDFLLAFLIGTALEKNIYQKKIVGKERLGSNWIMKQASALSRAAANTIMNRSWPAESSSLSSPIHVNLAMIYSNTH